MTGDEQVEHVKSLASGVVAAHDPASAGQEAVLGAWFDSGLTWIHFPQGRGGLGLPRSLQSVADEVLTTAGGVLPRLINKNACGFVAPTLMEFGSEDLLARHLRAIACGQEVWCQLFSEPGAGSDLAALSAIARLDGDNWRVTGQKVWSSQAHRADWGILLARTNPDAPKHKGITYFVVDMRSAGIEIRPLRQATGRAEFNEVFLDDVVVPDCHRIGPVDAGWPIARATLIHERMSVADRHGGARQESPLADALEVWRSNPGRHNAVSRDRLAGLWARAQSHRLTCERLRGAPAMKGNEGSVAKLAGAALNQDLYEFCADMMGADISCYGSYAADGAEEPQYRIQERFLRSRANTIEGGTAEIQRNLVAERILGLPPEFKADAGKSWREARRG